MLGLLQRQVSRGGEGREMSLNNIKSPQPPETGSKLLYAQTNIKIEFP